MTQIIKCCKCKNKFPIEQLIPMTENRDKNKKRTATELYCCHSCKKLWDKEYLHLINRPKWMSEEKDYDEYCRVFFELFLQRYKAFIFR